MNEEDRFVAVAALDRRTLRQLLELWWGLSASSLQASFEESLPEMISILAASQATAASVGAEYLNSSTPGAAVQVRPESFAGVASDGRPLAGLLSQVLVQVFIASQAKPLALAMETGADALDRIVTTQIQDAARGAEQVVIGANTAVKGYRRIVEPGACGRCIILAGRFYRWNDGFDRHPRCRCEHSAVTGESDDSQDPKALFDGMTREDQDRAFTVAGAKAIRLGADPSRVVNARRGMSTATSETGKQMLSRDVMSKLQFTTQELTGKGKFKNRIRLMPESILEQATTKAEARRLLRKYLYII